MDYRLPTIKNKNDINEYLEEHFQNREYDVIICQDLLVKDYSEWVSQIQNNATAGNGDWGKSLLLLCYDDSKIVGILCVRYELTCELESICGNVGYSVRPSERKKDMPHKCFTMLCQFVKRKE